MKSDQTAHAENRRPPAVSDSVDLTTTLTTTHTVAEIRQVGSDSSLKASGDTTNVTTETISASVVGPERTQFAHVNLSTTNNEPTHSAPTSPVKVQARSIDAALQVASNPPSAGSSDRGSVTPIESADIQSNGSVPSNVASEVTDQPAINSVIEIAGFSRVSQPASGPEQKQFAPSNLVTKNNERAHSVATSPAKVQTSRDTISTSGCSQPAERRFDGARLSPSYRIDRHTIQWVCPVERRLRSHGPTGD